MTRPEVPAGAALPIAAGWAHLAFQAGGRQAVDELTVRLSANGFPVVSGPRTTGDGCYESCVEDPDGNRIEITV